MRYQKLTGIVLKKQNYREADQIVTVWTQETGKIRVLGKALRKPTSKLNYHLQDLSLVHLEISGKNLPVVINARTQEGFRRLRENLPKIAAGLYAAELLMRSTADESPNTQAHDLLVNLLRRVDQPVVSAPDTYQLVDQYTIDLFKVLGFGEPSQQHSHSDIKQFVEDVLERQIKSEQFLTLV